MKRKKVVFFGGRMIMGGLEMVLKNLVDELARFEDLEIVVCARVKEPYFLDWFAANADRIKLHNSQFFRIRHPRRGLVGKLAYRLWGASADRYVKRILADADIVVDFVSSWNYKLVKNFSGRKIVWVHPGFGSIMRTLNIADILKYDDIVCLTKSCLDDFVSVFPEHSENITNIYNTVPYRNILAKAQNQSAPTGKYFVSVTRLDWDKDVSTLLAGFDRFWRDNGRPDVRLYVVGEGPLRDQMQAIAENMESHNQIVFTGKIPEPYAYMRNSLAHILSSMAEGLPTVLIEAAAAGALNIASDCKSGPGEILMRGSAGLLFTPGNWEELARLMADVYFGRVDRDGLIANANAGLTRFDAENVVPRVRELLIK